MPQRPSVAAIGIIADHRHQPRKWKNAVFQDELAAKLADVTGVTLF